VCVRARVRACVCVCVCFDPFLKSRLYGFHNIRIQNELNDPAQIFNVSGHPFNLEMQIELDIGYNIPRY